MINSEKIRELLKYGERITLECKDSRNEISKSVWETYSSFANTCGGIILLGIEEHMSEVDMKKRFTFKPIIAAAACAAIALAAIPVANHFANPPAVQHTGVDNGNFKTFFAGAGDNSILGATNKIGCVCNCAELDYHNDNQHN